MPRALAIACPDLSLGLGWPLVFGPIRYNVRLVTYFAASMMAAIAFFNMG